MSQGRFPNQGLVPNLRDGVLEASREMESGSDRSFLKNVLEGDAEDMITTNIGENKRSLTRHH